MNCDEYLSTLATRSADELALDRARGHASSCAQCERVTTIVVEREREMLAAFLSSSSAVPALYTADAALATSRRRATGRKYEIGLSALLAAVVLFMAQTMLVPRLRERRADAAMVTETFRLQCLSPEQALDLLQGYGGLTARSRVSFHSGWELNAIKVQAPSPDLLRARAVIDQYDNPSRAQCAATKPRPVKP